MTSIWRRSRPAMCLLCMTTSSGPLPPRCDAPRRTSYVWCRLSGHEEGQTCVIVSGHASRHVWASLCVWACRERGKTSPPSFCMCVFWGENVRMHAAMFVPVVCGLVGPQEESCMCTCMHACMTFVGFGVMIVLLLQSLKYMVIVVPVGRRNVGFDFLGECHIILLNSFFCFVVGSAVDLFSLFVNQCVLFFAPWCRVLSSLVSPARA
jgi:hypothetical protein